MKIFYVCLISAVIITSPCFNSDAQNLRTESPSVALGSAEKLISTFKKNTAGSNLRTSIPQLELQLPEGTTLKGNVNLTKSDATFEYNAIGSIEGDKSSTFYIRANNSTLEGSIILKNSKKAYKYFSDKNGNAFVQKVDINSLLCIDYERIKQESASAQRTTATTATAATTAIDLQSYPGANGCVLLDFDGQTVTGTLWNNDGQAINAEPSGMTDSEIRETWELVSEDFRPFSVNITTNESVFNSYPKTKRMRCIITPTNTAAPGAGGVAYVGSFSWGDDTPCWVFITSPKATGEASSHEIGHTLGLNHDGRTNPEEAYYAGQGNWAPIMGVGYYESITQWSKGEYAYPDNTENDVLIIAGSTNGIGYRSDNHGNTYSAATPLAVSSTGSIYASSNKGGIEKSIDIDFFSFTTSGGSISINIKPAARHANLDIVAKLYNKAGTVISTHNPVGLPSSINTSLAAGTYYISVDGVGAGNPTTTGYPHYGSLGSYTISGTIPVSGTNRAPSVSITSPTNGANFSAPANITISASSADTDGSIVKVEFYKGTTKIGEDLSSPYSYTWTNVSAGNYTLTARAIDNTGAQSNSPEVNISVNSTASNVAIVFQNCNYNTSGYAISLPPGNYTTADLLEKGIKDNDISSLKITSGYEIVLYKDNNYLGGGYSFSADYACLVNISFNDVASSIIVRTATSTMQTRKVSSSLNISSLENVEVFPNPFDDDFKIDLKGGTGHFQIFDAFNKEVITGKVESGKKVNMSGLKSGVYLIKIYNEKNVVTKRIIKQ